jgi:hypothetical protein
VDIAYTMAVLGIPKSVILRAIRSRVFLPNVRHIANGMRRLQEVSRWRMRARDRRARRPNLLQMYPETPSGTSPRIGVAGAPKRR